MNDSEEITVKNKLYKGPISRLRKEITKVSDHLTPLAVKNIAKRLSGEEVDEGVLADSKWVMTLLNDLYGTAVREEQVKVRVKEKRDSMRSPTQPTPTEGGEGEEDEEEQPTPAKPRFSMTLQDQPSEENAPDPDQHSYDLTDDEF